MLVKELIEMLELLPEDMVVVWGKHRIPSWWTPEVYSAKSLPWVVGIITNQKNETMTYLQIYDTSDWEKYQDVADLGPTLYQYYVGVMDIINKED